ncbi:peptidoglycan recognition protein family protein [Mucisphaera sp.]|uniref:peptidoglycan recognition protein family protein n=1 Tax=Mucisphaera sp. TaxID=2913024 RepID=UPI003D0D426E
MRDEPAQMRSGDGERARAVGRRGVLVGGVGLLLAGCVDAGRPKGWASNGSGIVQSREGGYYMPRAAGDGEAVAAGQPDWQPAPVPGAARRVEALPRVASGVPGVVGRSSWTDSGPIQGRVRAMSGIRRVTVHHEGWTPVYFEDASSTRDRLQQILKVHVKDRGWGDIGYHFVVDRAGRVWEARPLVYQGAHAGPNGANEHNVGVLVLGNFDRQRPSDRQFAGLVQTLRWLGARYRVGVGGIYTHQELNPTACPGKVLQAQMDALRKHPGLL